MGNFSFTPVDGLLDVSAFPSEPGSEGQARQQFMTLFNQIKTYLNTFDANGIRANGGNSDTVDNKHASEFATSTHNHDARYSLTTHNHDATYSKTTHNHDTDYLDKTAQATDSNKVKGKNIFVQQAQPTAQATGDVWISW